MAKTSEVDSNDQSGYKNMEEFWRDYNRIEDYLKEQEKDKASYQKLIRIYGTNIKNLRKTVNMPQATLARILGMSVPSLNQIESGKRKSIEPNYIYKIADFFLCSPDNLLGRATKYGYIWDAATKKEVYPPFLVSSQYQGLYEINRGMFMVYVRNQRLYRILMALFSTRDLRTYERMADLLWATFSKELESMGLTSEDLHKDDWTK